MITDQNEKNFYKAVGAALKSARRAAGMNQSELAKRVGLSRTSITNIECGNQAISLYNAALLADALPEWRGNLTPAALDRLQRGQRSVINSIFDFLKAPFARIGGK